MMILPKMREAQATSLTYWRKGPLGLLPEKTRRLLPLLTNAVFACQRSLKTRQLSVEFPTNKLLTQSVCQRIGILFCNKQLQKMATSTAVVDIYNCPPYWDGSEF